MTKVRRPILIVVNLLALLLGVACLITSIVVTEANLVLRHHPPKDEVKAEVYQITDVSKLQTMAVNQYKQLDALATIIEEFRDMALVAAILILSFGVLNIAFIPWRLRKREECIN